MQTTYALILMLIAAQNSIAGTIYISPSGNSSLPGTSTASPTTLENANLIAVSGDIIEFADGTYPVLRTLRFAVPVQLTGTTLAMLDCSSVPSGICVQIRSGNASTFSVNGLVFLDGNSGSTGASLSIDNATVSVSGTDFIGNDTGIRINDSTASVSISSSVFSNNQVGIEALVASELTISTTRFSANSSRAIALKGSSNATVTENTFDSNARAIYIRGSTESPTISKNTFSDDQTAIEVVTGASPHIINNLIQNATADGVISSSSSTVFTYNTVVSSAKNGISLRSSDTSTIYNSVFYGNGSSGRGRGINADTTSRASAVGANAFYLNQTGTYSSGMSDSGGHITNDPHFVSATDFHLHNGSPLRDKANATLGTASEDVEGNPRIQVTSSAVSANDIGAYESQPIIRLIYTASTYTGVGKDPNYQVVDSAISSDGIDFYDESGHRIPETPNLTDPDAFKVPSGNWVIFFSKAMDPTDTRLYRATSPTITDEFTIDASFSSTTGSISSTLAVGSDFYVYGYGSSGGINLSHYDSTAETLTAGLTNILSNASTGDPSAISLSSTSFLLFYKIIGTGTAGSVYVATSSDASTWTTSTSALVSLAEVPGAIVVDGAIYLYYANQDMAYSCNMCVKRSYDSGSTWTSPDTVTGVDSTGADPNPVAYE